jgi:hypothetical protein
MGLSFPGGGGQPMLIFAADIAALQQAYQQAIERNLTRAVYIRAMFSTGHDAANRAAFKAEPADAPDLVGFALRGPKKNVDKATKGVVSGARNYQGCGRPHAATAVPLAVTL